MKNKELHKINQGSELKNPKSSTMGEDKYELDNEIFVAENYTQNEFDAQINEYDTIQNIEDLSPDYIIRLDDLCFELNFELKHKIDQTRYPETPNDRNYFEYRILKLWKNILKDLGNLFSSRELYAIAYNIGTYAEVCTNPYERRKEIRRNFAYREDWFIKNHINCEELEAKILEIDPEFFFELTEILIYSDSVCLCRMDPEKSDQYPLLECDFLISSSSDNLNHKK